MGPELLHVEDVETSAPAPNEVQLHVEAAAVNPVDLATRAGLLPDNTPRWPLVLGWDAAGTISAVGRDVTKFAVGQRAVGMSFQPATQVGTYAEQVVLAAEDVAALPAGLDTESAATVPLAGLTALQALDLLDLTLNDTLFINGILGAVGGFAAQLARLAGVRVVAAVRRSDVHAAHQLGADIVLDRDQHLPAQLGTALPDRVTASLDVVGGAAAHAALDLELTSDGGRYVTAVPL